MSIFGQILSADEVEDAVVNTVELWFKTWAREFELQHGLPQDALPALSYLVADQIDRESAMPLPSMVVVSPGLIKQPEMEGDGSFTATYGMAVAIFVSANDRRNTERLVRQYAAILRDIILKKQSLGGLTDGVVWRDESFDDDFGFVDNQTVSAGQVLFEVVVRQVSTKYGGPVEPTPPDPDVQPGSNWPTADVITATVKPKE